MVAIAEIIRTDESDQRNRRAGFVRARKTYIVTGSPFANSIPAVRSAAIVAQSLRGGLADEKSRANVPAARDYVTVVSKLNEN